MAPPTNLAKVAPYSSLAHGNTEPYLKLDHPLMQEVQKTFQELDVEDPLYQFKRVLLEKYVEDLSKSFESYQFRFGKLASFSLTAQAGYDWAAFNGSGLTHSGWQKRIAAGLRINHGTILRGALNLRGFYASSAWDYQPEVGNLSQTQATIQGIELWDHFELLPRTHLGLGFGLGQVDYQSGPSGTLLQGPNPVTLDTQGKHFELGGQACVLNMKLCIGLRHFWDWDLKVEEQGLSSKGWSFYLQGDLPAWLDDRPSPMVVDFQIKNSLKIIQDTLNHVENSESDREILEFVKELPENFFPYTTVPSQFTVETFINEASALEGLLQNPPLILAIGEAHRFPNYPQDPLDVIFTDKILPLLKEHYDYLVFEGLPANTPQQELDYFMRTGKLDSPRTPFLTKYLKNWDESVPHHAAEARNILVACQRNGIKLKGGGPYYGDGSSFDAKVKKIAQNTQAAIEALVSQGYRVMAYNGTSHNELKQYRLGKPNMNTEAFGDELHEKYGKNYVELDLIDPAYLTFFFRHSKSWIPLEYLRLYSPYIPPSGSVSLVQRYLNSYALVYPFVPLLAQDIEKN